MIMKRGKLLLIPALLSFLPLAGCTTTDSEYFTVTVSDNSKIVVEMPHKLGEKPSEKFKPGDGVIFRVGMVTDVDTVVTLNGSWLSSRDFKYGDESEENRWSIAYAFVMPKANCEISVYLSGGGIW